MVRNWRPRHIYDDDPVHMGAGQCEADNCGIAVEPHQAYCFFHLKLVPPEIRAKGDAAIAAYAYEKRKEK